MDSYAPCPCGSGKKVKFCCQAILPEMAKVERLQENNQPRMALQLIDKLLRDHNDNPWLVNQRGMALIADHRNEEARDTLVAFLRQSPENPLSNALLALAMTEIEPIENCKKVIHRAFLKSMTVEPRVVAVLASRLVDHYLENGREMAARQHMAVVLRLESEQERQQTLLAMLEFDSDTAVPYPLRGAHPLPSYNPPEAIAQQVKKAQRLFIHACFSEAANQLDQIVAQDDNSAELHHTIGLMRAWDGDVRRASESLHRAAMLYQGKDPERAVDVETISQLLARELPEENVSFMVRSYSVESLSRLLTRLDNEDRLSRVPMMDESYANSIAGAYNILDRAVPADKELQTASLESIPRAVGQLTLIDSPDPNIAPRAHLNAIQGEQFEEAVRIFEKAAGELVKPATTADGQPEPDSVKDGFPKEDLPLAEAAFFPPQTPNGVRNRLRKQFIEESVPKIWLDTPLKALNGQSPKQAAGDAALKVQLAAALRVFDSFMDRRSVILENAPLKAQLGITTDTPIVLGADQDLNTYSVAQLLRLQSQELPDDVFDRVLQRAIVVKHCGLGHRLLSEFLNDRKELLSRKSQEAEQAYITLSDLCSRSLRDQEAFDWLRRGFQFSKENGASFETLLTWKMREVSLRARDTEDPAFKEVLLEVWNQYGSKLPAVRARLDEFVRAIGVEAPWQNAIITPGFGDTVGATAWAGDSTDASTAEKKLWLPD